LESFFYVLKRYEERKSHNMLCLMLIQDLWTFI
jgi:hypothetical protein